jgi:L-galactose dehydrogenase
MTRTFTSDTGTFPSFCFGAGVFSGAYNAISKEDAYAAVRRALDRGVRLFDTAPYYGDSEIILGEALRRVASVYPRSSYQLSTKIGRYGLKRTDFDYSAARIRASIKQSLARLGTNYLDVVFCHDVEFVTPEQVLDEALPTLYELKVSCPRISLLSDDNHPHRTAAHCVMRIGTRCNTSCWY